MNIIDLICSVHGPVGDAIVLATAIICATIAALLALLGVV